MASRSSTTIYVYVCAHRSFFTSVGGRLYGGGQLDAVVHSLSITDPT